MKWKCEDCQKDFPLSNMGPKRKTFVCNKCLQVRWRLINKDYLLSYRQVNKIQIYTKAKEWFLSNKERRREYKRNYYKSRKENDPHFKIKVNLRSRLSDAVKGKCKSTEKLLGCSYKDFIQHLSNKFYQHPITGEAMTLENYGKWHVDHIKPLCTFDLTDTNQLQEACKYTNLQPLWYIDHVKKTSSDLKLF